MARTTAFPCAIAARLILQGKISEKGVLPPERFAHTPGVFEAMVEALSARGVRLVGRCEPLVKL
jgi:saccharopine dehydrogenase-like NADP-dependent oxidoreductase